MCQEVCGVQAVPGVPWASMLPLLGLWETSPLGNPVARGSHVGLSHQENRHHVVYLDFGSIGRRGPAFTLLF